MKPLPYLSASSAKQSNDEVYVENMFTLTSTSPIDGATLCSLPVSTLQDTQEAIELSHQAFLAWRQVPAPQRGELVRHMGNVFRAKKEQLAYTITVEAGKIREEALGEVQEVIDICDFAVGLSRQLHGLTIASERPQHRLSEQWHPLGVVAIVTAFNFPMAVWAWNAALALVCGDSIIWKPSMLTPLCAEACQQAFREAVVQCSFAPPPHLSQVLHGDADIVTTLAQHSKVALVSLTGSTEAGKAVAPIVAKRLGRSLLELGGNAAMIVAPSANLDLAVKAAVFSAIGTTGQRCTSLRRLAVHSTVQQTFLEKLRRAYSSIKVGDPHIDGVHVGPIITEKAMWRVDHAAARALDAGGRQVCAAPFNIDFPSTGTYSFPRVIEVQSDYENLTEEVFGPLLWLTTYSDFKEAIDFNNAVPQGLSSTVITSDVREAELFCSATGSDCGIANVNIGTSGAEIGGAFGGEKDTGGGRESGSDAWKNYMRRQTNTVNYGNDLPLAQGIKFDV